MLISESGVREKLNVAKKKLKEYKYKSDHQCNCAVDANDHRGPCSNCTGYEFWGKVVEKGEALLKAPIEEFHTEAEGFLRLVASRNW